MDQEVSGKKLEGVFGPLGSSQQRAQAQERVAAVFDEACCFDGNEPPEVVSALERIVERRERDLQERGAIDMVAGSEFIGYLRHEDDGRYSVEVISWGRNLGKIFGDDKEKLVQDVYEQMDGAERGLENYLVFGRTKAEI